MTYLQCPRGCCRREEGKESCKLSSFVLSLGAGVSDLRWKGNEVTCCLNDAARPSGRILIPCHSVQDGTAALGKTHPRFIPSFRSSCAGTSNVHDTVSRPSGHSLFPLLSVLDGTCVFGKVHPHLMILMGIYRALSAAESALQLH